MPVTLPKVALIKNRQIAGICAGRATDTRQTNAASIAAPIPTTVSIQLETRTTLGDPNAPVTIVEFSDYLGPFCARHSQETFPRLKEAYIDTGRVFYVFKDFPIDRIHPQAQKVHEAAYCGREQGGELLYWQMHDLPIKRFGVCRFPRIIFR